MNHYLDDLIISSKHILLLQGPTGPFFAKFSTWLKTQNKTVFKINLNAGDEYFYPKELGNVFAYQDTLEQFPTYLKDFCQQNKIDNIICFGDSRKYHQIAKNISTQLNIAFWAFEEGYFRPHYVTFEKGGVNAFSILPKNADFFLEQSHQLEIKQPQALAKGFAPMSKCASKYYIAANLGKKNYPYYQNHKPFNLGYYAKLWTISGIKRAYYALQDIRFAKRVEKGEFGDFFIVPLQVYDDVINLLLVRH